MLFATAVNAADLRLSTNHDELSARNVTGAAEELAFPSGVRLQLGSSGLSTGTVTVTDVPTPLRPVPVEERIGPTQLWQLQPARTRIRDGTKTWVTSWNEGAATTTLPDALGSVTSLKDSRGRLLSLAAFGGNPSARRNASIHAGTSCGSPLLRGYVYDARGNPIEETDGSLTRRFAYDDSDRLIAAQEWSGEITAWRLHQDGRRDGEKRFPTGTPWPTNFATAGHTLERKYGYDILTGGLTDVDDVTVPAATTRVAAWEYDGAGRVTSRTVNGVSTTHQWDVLGRMISAGGLAFEYDGQGMRRGATGGGLPARQFTYVGETLVAENGEPHVAVGPYALAQGGVRFGHDALGSVIKQVSASSPTPSMATFSAWGKQSGGPQLTSVGFTGYLEEPLVGAKYAKQRWADDEFGVFLSRDSIGAGSYLQSPNGLGPWSYANLNPSRYTDPDGREAADCVRMGMEWGTPEWNADPLCHQLSNGQAMTLAMAAYRADQAGFTDPSADRAFNEHMAFKRWHSKYIGRPLFAASAAMAGAFSATACALNPTCQAAAAKSAGPVLSYGLFSSGAGTWSVAHNWAGSCWTSATGGGEEASAADAECWFGVGAASPAAKPAWNAVQALKTKAVSAISPTVEIAGALDGLATAEARAVRWSSSGASWKSKSDPTGWGAYYAEELGLDELAGMGVELESGTGMSLGRPSWRKTELDSVADLKGMGFSDQTSFLNGKPVPYGTPGSVRPDLYSENFRFSVDDKNYNLSTSSGRGNLLQNVLKQVGVRNSHLPAGTRQGLILDIRGQSGVQEKFLERLIRRIQRRTNGAISEENVVILRDK